jgi:thymidylate synthase (FAD)
MTAKYLQIIAIDPDGFEMTYDLEVAGPHPNFVANGFVTHNSQLSQRYVSAEETAFVIPPAILEDEYAIQVLKNQCEDALLRYRALVEHIGQDTEKKRKQVREAARAVLPNCTETKIVVTGNVRAWRTFIEARATAAADAEMCRLANYVLQILQETAPEFFQDMAWAETDGRRHVHVLHRKV